MAGTIAKANTVAAAGINNTSRSGRTFAARKSSNSTMRKTRWKSAKSGAIARPRMTR
jgi:hypothetical protein